MTETEKLRTEVGGVSENDYFKMPIGPIASGLPDGAVITSIGICFDGEIPTDDPDYCVDLSTGKVYMEEAEKNVS